MHSEIIIEWLQSGSAASLVWVRQVHGPKEKVGKGGGFFIFYFSSLFDEAFVVERPDQHKALMLRRLSDDCEAHSGPSEDSCGS